MEGLSNSRRSPHVQFLRDARELPQSPNSEQASNTTLPNNEFVPVEHVLQTENRFSDESADEDWNSGESTDEDWTFIESNARSSKYNVRLEDPVPMTYGDWAKDRTPDLYEEISLDIQGALDMKVAVYMDYLQEFYPVYLGTFSSFIEDVHAAEIEDFTLEPIHSSLLLKSFMNWSRGKKSWFVLRYPQMNEYDLFRRTQSAFSAKLGTSSREGSMFIAEIKFREREMRNGLESQTWDSLGLSGFEET